MIITNGINVSRRIGAGGGANVTEEIHSTRTKGIPPFLQQAVVVDIIFDPTNLTDAELQEIASSVSNPDLAHTMPRNSILARIVSNSHDVGAPTPKIFYPFFSSHLSLPVKAGEQVFIVFPDPQSDTNELGYWITRVPEAATIEDANYTHGDRRYDPELNPNNASTSTRARQNDNPSIPSFPNGASTVESLSLHVNGSDGHPYESIVSNSRASAQFTPEPVPRYSKRPGEFVCQGSNNARIVVGEDHVSSVTRVQGVDKVGFAGTIDLVAGVGAIRKFPQSSNDDPGADTHNPTSPRIVGNVRHLNEVDKAPFLRQKQNNPNEGDPDFKRDLSRVYLTMKTAGDKNFEIKKTNLVPDGKLITDIEDLPDSDSDGQPFFISKSEQIRVIATGKDADNGPAVAGQIRFIKEGKEQDKDLGLFWMNSEGEIIQIGKNIQLLTHEDGKLYLQTKTGTAQAGEGEPYIKYSEYKKTIEGLQSQINTLESFIKNTVLQTVIGSLNASTCVPFSPDAACVTAATLAQTVGETLTGQLQPDKTNVENATTSAQSAVIFGK